MKYTTLLFFVGLLLGNRVEIRGQQEKSLLQYGAEGKAPQFMAMGMTMQEVIESSTWNPAKDIKSKSLFNDKMEYSSENSLSINPTCKSKI